MGRLFALADHLSDKHAVAISLIGQYRQHLCDLIGERMGQCLQAEVGSFGQEGFDHLLVFYRADRAGGVDQDAAGSYRLTGTA